MRIISIQRHVSISILFEKIKKEKEHRIAINLISPDVGVCIDGHHSYVASMSTHRPIRIVVADLHHSNNLSSGGVLDYWAAKTDVKDPDPDPWGNFYDLMTGEAIKASWLRKIVDQYPDYRYSV